MSEVTLALADIQGTALRNRPEHYYGTYILYRIDNAADAREMLRQILPHVTSAAGWDKPVPFTLNIVFTWQGLKALGLGQDSLDSFPAEFRAGMASRKDVLGDLGENDPDNWIEPFGSPDVHVGILIAAANEQSFEEPLQLAMGARAGLSGVTPIYRLDVELPANGREHFGFKDGIGRPHVIGSSSVVFPGQDPIMPGEFILGEIDEEGGIAPMPLPEILGRNGTYLAFRQYYQDVAAFRRYLKENAKNVDDEEYLAAKMVGRWRSGAPLALSPSCDDPELGADPSRNNDFSYADSDPNGLACPMGAHIRRCNPRDSLSNSIVDVKRHRLLRGGTAYGPTLPEGITTDDGIERGIVFIFMGASLSRQFEFIQQVWIQQGDFIGMGAERDPLIGSNGGTGDFTIPSKPLRRRLKGLPNFAVVRGGEYCFLPSLSALRWLTQEE